MELFRPLAVEKPIGHTWAKKGEKESSGIDQAGQTKTPYALLQQIVRETT
jgi:hypothetical protein